MLFTSNNCVVYSKDPDLIGKLVMHGHKVHYSDNIQNLMKQIQEIHPDLVVLDFFKEIASYDITMLIQINGYTLIRWPFGEEVAKKIDTKKVIILPTDSTTEEVLEKINHLNDSANMKQTSTKPRILIIEDNPDILELYSVAFISRWYDVSLATDWLSGMTKAVNLRPEIIILDIMMPHMDGFEVLHTLKNNTSLQSIVVVNSNLEWVDEEKKAKDLWADYFLRKSSYTPLAVVSFIEKEVLHIGVDD